MTLELQPITLREANRFVLNHHRHHGPTRGCLFCVAVNNGSEVIGVAIVGRPVSRMLQDGYTAEILRICTLPGNRNACSKLYGACRRAVFAIGWRRLITYTLNSETGESLRGAGFKCLGLAGGGSWSRPSRPRVDTSPICQKLLWEVA